MTENESNSIHGRVLETQREAERDWLCRQADTRDLAIRLRQAADILDRNAAFPLSGEDCLAGPPPTQHLPQHEYQAVFDYDRAITSLTELKKARLRLYDASQQVSMLFGVHSINTR